MQRMGGSGECKGAIGSHRAERCREVGALEVAANLSCRTGETEDEWIFCKNAM